MLCYRCGSHVPDSSESCPNCGQQLKAGVSRGGVDSGRKRPSELDWEGAPYKQEELIAGRYTVLGLLGRGPLGWVLKAKDKELEVEVAIKVMNPGLIRSGSEAKQFSKVLRAGRKISHQNLVRLFEDGEDKGNYFYTFQCVDGLSLRSILDLRKSKGQLFSLQEAEPILAQVTLALEEIHKQGAHTDFKPENVTVMPDLLKVGDYGLGQALPRPMFLETLTGKPALHYLAPEGRAGKEIDRKSDVFAYGVLLGEMLAGVLPEKDIPDLLRRNPSLPEEIQRIYEKALSKEPRKRFQSMTELFAAVNEATQKKAPPVPAESVNTSEQEKTELTDPNPNPNPNSPAPSPVPLSASLEKPTGQVPQQVDFEGPPSVSSHSFSVPPSYSQSKRIITTNTSWLWLVLLTVLGLGVGAFVGDWLLTSPTSSTEAAVPPHRSSP